MRGIFSSLFSLILFWVGIGVGSACGQSLVFDFESGELQKDGWLIVSGANSLPVGARDSEFHHSVPYKKQGKYYLTTLEQAGDPGPTDDPQCVIESPVFNIEGKEARFAVGGGQRPKTYIALCIFENDDSPTPVEVLQARGNNTQGLDEVVWDISPWLGKSALFRVVDEEQGGWAHIRADNFRLDAIILSNKTQEYREEIVAQRVRAEKHNAEIQARKRELILANPAVCENPILYIRRTQYLPDHHNTETMFQTKEICTSSFRGGADLKVWFPQTNETITLLSLPEGVVRDPSLSFDADKVLLSIRCDVSDDYHIYEMDLDVKRPTIVIDSKTDKATIVGLRQLTWQKGLSDIDPIYLPSGQVLFSSSREPKYCMCNRHIMCNLYTMNTDGSNLEQIGKSTLFEGHPQLMPDGRILYDRWEYVDRNFGDAQGLWVTNPDGTNHAIFWGNNTSSPGAVLEGRIVPDHDSLFICTFSSCHDRPWGAIALVDRQLGLDGRAPVIQTWPASAIDLVEVGDYDSFIRISQKFEDPFPLSDTLFLASGMVGRGEEMGIWLLDTSGEMTLLHEDAPGCYDPQPIVPTEAPPVIAGRIDLTDPMGYFYVSDVSKGFGMEDVDPKSIKSVRVVESPEKRFWTVPAWDYGNGTQAPGMAWDDFNNKRIIGTADVEEDGSVFFEVPADTFVYLQLLDEQGMMIQSMRSGTIVRPGETNGCFGCHESRLETPPQLNYTPKAMMKGPQKLTPWYGPTRLFSYIEEVQPVFDRYCVTCHDFDKPAGEKLVLAGDRNLVFNTSYKELRSKDYLAVPGAGPSRKLLPLTWGSRKSKLYEVLTQGHPDATVDAKRKELGIYLDPAVDKEAFDRIITWIDINAPYYPTYAAAYPNNRFGRSPLDEEDLNKLRQLTGVDPLWTVSFDRPEMSGCLKGLNKSSVAYSQALALIEKGKANLARQPRGEASDFQPVVPGEIAQQAKYDRFRRWEQEMRKAIIEGKKLYEKDLPIFE